MDQKFLNEMKKVLIEMKEEILQNIISENSDFMDVARNVDVKDSVDLAANDVDVRMLETISAHDKKRLQKVQAALGRIENNNFGICVKCQKKIEKPRLKAIPYAALCIHCQQGSEH